MKLQIALDAAAMKLAESMILILKEVTVDTRIDESIRNEYLLKIEEVLKCTDGMV
jgi:hypothetical protein